MRVMSEDVLERVAEYNVAYQREFGRAPSFRQIMHAVGLGSLATVQRYVKALEREDRLNCDSDGKIEAVPNLAGGESIVVPLLGEIACGEPNFAVENIEGSYTFPKDLFGSGELFMLRTFGDSMKDIGIQKGDLIVVRRQNSADDGQVVVALVDGNATLKRIFHRDGKIILHPENKRMKDIELEECDIQGVLVSCIKLY